MDPRAFEVFADVLSGKSTDEAVRGQEARGQQQLVNCDILPARGLKALEAFGVKVTGPVEGDSLFMRVELPEGWKKVPTDHSMWSDLLDETGKKRASIFYKAAFYDRHAFINVCKQD